MRTGAVSSCQDGTPPVPYRGMRFVWERMAPSPITSLPITACGMWITDDRRSLGRQLKPLRTISDIAHRRQASGILRAANAPWQPRWRPVIAVALAVSLLALVGHAAMLHSETHRSHHHSHALLSEVGGAFAVNVNHAHLFNGSLTECHDVLASAVLPRTGATLVDLGVAVAMVAIIASLASRVAASVRGPPEFPPAALAGQDLLRRFCLSRR